MGGRAGALCLSPVRIVIRRPYDTGRIVRRRGTGTRPPPPPPVPTGRRKCSSGWGGRFRLFSDPVVKGRLRRLALFKSAWQNKQWYLHFRGGQTAVVACEMHGESVVFVPPDGLGGFGQDQHVADPRHKFA